MRRHVEACNDVTDMMKKNEQNNAYAAAQSPCVASRCSVGRTILNLISMIALAVLSKLQAFMPKLRNANCALGDKAIDDNDIEKLTDPDGPYIEMVCCSPADTT